MTQLRRRGPALASAIQSGCSPLHDGFIPQDDGSHLGLDKEGPRRASLPGKAYGRTPDGTTFVVPTTHDMVSQLLDPRQPKNVSDGIVLLIIALHIAAYWMLPPQLCRSMLAVMFVCWRAAYNLGIGQLLRYQSNHRSLVVWARRLGLFADPSCSSYPRLSSLLRRELEAKLSADECSFATTPIEYNTWLLFRRLVDLILMCDFTSYCLFAIACAHRPFDEGIFMFLSRWTAGLTLVGFNVWVKLDAHRVVKDYAWYWGDFFFLIDQELTFDGVFEIAPHPMYSIGYAGYYGISMMSASYEVLFISILAHLAQFAFLALVENPHIEKTYNRPPPRKVVSSASSEPGYLAPSPTPSQDGETHIAASQPLDSQGSDYGPQPQLNGKTPSSNASVHKLVGPNNIDLYRVTDYSIIFMVSYLAILTAATPNTPLVQGIFLAHAFAWRLWYHVGLGLILTAQSRTKMWTRHFVKFGESAHEAWRQWKSLYHISMVMSYASAVSACYKMYSPPDDWGYGWVLLEHVVGVSLVTLQAWTAASIYESLGEFGWFFGDFFFDQEAKLTYTSIYRFLNDPERIFGSAGLWGAALLTWSRSIFAMAMANQLLQLAFIAYIEKPHMQKIYGRKLRRDAGLTKFLKRSLPPHVIGWQESVDKVLDETTRFVEEFVEFARPRFAAGVKTIVRDTSVLFNLAPARLSLTRLGPTVELEQSHALYSLTVDKTPHLLPSDRMYADGKGETESLPGSRALVYEFGTPLTVTWTAPAAHHARDWIGLYKVTDNRSRELTEVSSQGRWAPTVAGHYDAITADCSIAEPEHRVPGVDGLGPELVRGQVVFFGDKLWWTEGVLEVRYHYADTHTVLAISPPFEVRVGRFSDEDDEEVSGNATNPTYVRAVEEELFHLVCNCFDRDRDVAPANVDEPFGPLVECDGKYAKRVVYAVRQKFGVEFAPAVVTADRSVRKLAWRICHAKEVLAPYSMSGSHSKSRMDQTTAQSNA